VNYPFKTLSMRLKSRLFSFATKNRLLEPARSRTTHH